MPLCESCDETSPSPVSTVNLTLTQVSIGDGTGLVHEWTDEGDGNVAFTMDAEFLAIFEVVVGGTPQSEDAYTVAGTTITFDAAPPAGAIIIVRGAIETP